MSQELEAPEDHSELLCDLWNLRGEVSGGDKTTVTDAWALITAQVATIRSLSARLAAAEAENVRLRQGLTDVCEAKALGRKHGECAYAISKNLDHIQSIARAALQPGAPDTANGETK